MFLYNNFPAMDIFHISRYDGECTNNFIIKTVGKILNKTPKIVNIEDRLNHDWRYSLDYDTTSNYTKWKPKTSIEEGLRKIIKK